MKATFVSALILTTILGGTLSPANAQLPSQRAANVQIVDGIPQIPGITFSEKQKEKLQKVNQEALIRIGEILTSQQREDLQASIELGNNPQEAIKTLNLSKEQKKEFKEVKEWQREQLKDILTREQKMKIMQMRQRRGRRGVRFGF